MIRISKKQLIEQGLPANFIVVGQSVNSAHYYICWKYAG